MLARPPRRLPLGHGDGGPGERPAPGALRRLPRAGRLRNRLGCHRLGVTDTYSWRASGTRLLFDGDYDKRPEYDAVIAALGGTPDDSGGTGACTATYARTADWSTGYNGRVTVKAGDCAISSRTVTLTLPSGRQVAAVWNGTPSTSGQVVTVRPVGWNSALGAGASTGFGCTVNKNGSNADPVVGTCTAS
ncbi:cellulose binding domain-containing protein [Streptomyces sp. NPDC005931]|uniref:cellulose binding domain-containing protein n=1 Tax=Streptomyces sp. NPDC005931 TaxID=3364737 RepID=UPI0036C4144C